ncbi:MAG: ribosome biogenesis GTP-binding protein YsxC, partial [Clostridia bacterium]|nr:ribosome biogenesis GTP-binding protein YsxC [Clostridia bacterium]
MAVNFQNVNLLLSAGDSRQFPKNGLPQIALSGRSNVGKSTLVNMLLGRKSLARVSGEPGKTVTINFYNVDGKFLLADLPGYGYARRPAAELEKLRTLTDAYFTANPGLDRLKLVLQLIDLKTGPSDDDWLMLDFLRQKGL